MDIAKIIAGVDKAAELSNDWTNAYLANDGLLHCAKCGGKLQTRVEFMGRERVVHCICQCQAEEMEQQKNAAKIEARKKRIAELRARGYRQDHIKHMTFKNDNGNNPKIMQVMQNYVDNFDKFKAEGKGLLLYGGVGTGKTYAAGCVCNALEEKQIAAYMTDFRKISNMLLNTFNSKQDIMDDLNRFDLLVFDDLGAERKTEYMQEVVYSVIDARYIAGLPFIVTTNLTLEEIKAPKTIEEARCYDRILERCHPVEVTGASQRRLKIRSDYAETKKILGL